MRDADLVQVEYPWQVPTLAGWNRPPRPLVLVAHNVESAVAEQAGRSPRAIEAIRSREYEAVASSAAVIVFTSEDRLGLIDRAGARPDHVHVIPLGVDVQRTKPAHPSAKARAKAALGLEGKCVALFVGSLYEPNVEAAATLFDIAAQGTWKDLVFLVVGRVGERLRSNGRVWITGGVSDSTPYFDAADLAVNPMRSGGGMQVKLLEFLAAGLPTVTTPIGARGLDALSGRDLIVAELPDFAGAIQSLVDDPVRAAEIGGTGRRLVEERYSWEAIAHQRVALYKSLLRAA
jgi:glycosyltransferase involved in cell wall biosynthesis